MRRSLIRAFGRAGSLGQIYRIDLGVWYLLVVLYCGLESRVQRERFRCYWDIVPIITLIQGLLHITSDNKKKYIKKHLILSDLKHQPYKLDLVLLTTCVSSTYSYCASN